VVTESSRRGSRRSPAPVVEAAGTGALSAQRVCETPYARGIPPQARSRGRQQQQRQTREPREQPQREQPEREYREQREPPQREYREQREPPQRQRRQPIADLSSSTVQPLQILETKGLNGETAVSPTQAFGGTLPPNVCPTPFALGPVCGRGERELPGWRRARSGEELLGTYGQMMSDTVRYILDVAASSRLRVLSAADGVADDTQTDMQARMVPTSVMLAHAFSMVAGNMVDPGAQVRLYGGDVRNPVSHWWQPQRLPWHLPGWLDHRFVALDNTRDFHPQLYSSSQCQEDQLFDVVLLRQGLCFCDDPSKTSPTWPCQVVVSRTQDSTVCGTYSLEPYLCEGRPSYRKGQCQLRWVHQRTEWAVLDIGGGTWACARGDVGHPVLARGPWAVWDGQAHVNDPSFVVSLAQPGSPPWHRAPNERVCCCGVGGDSLSVLYLLQRVAAVLDTRQPHSFGLLHGAWTNGTKVEVDQLHFQIEEAARQFNEQRRGAHAAAVLWRSAAQEYWLQCDGIVLFQPGSRADPFTAYGTTPYARTVPFAHAATAV